jgi:hypothetical protein
MTARPYAGQSWQKGLFPGDIRAASVLQLIAMDLAADADGVDIDSGSNIELWESEDSKGFFIGDTSGLVADGWTKIATLL